MTELRTRTRTVGGTIKVVVVSGDLDIEGADKLRVRLDKILSRRLSYLVLDLSNVEHLSSSGATLLYNYQKMTTDSGAGFGLLAPSVEARMVIDLVGGKRVFRIGDSLEELVGAPPKKRAAAKAKRPRKSARRGKTARTRKR